MRILHIIMGLSTIALVSCVKEVLREDNEPRSFDSFTVSVDDPLMTKVHVEDNGSVKWDDWDCIGIYSDIEGPKEFYRQNDGTFKGDSSISGTVFYAFYPYFAFEYDPEAPTQLKCLYQAASVVSKNQTIALNSPMIAKSNGNHLAFKQTCGLVHFRVTGLQNMQLFEIRPQNAEAINGMGTINILEENPFLTLKNGNGNTTDNYDFNNGPVPYSSVVISEAAGNDGQWDIFFPIPAMTWQDGFTLSIYYDNYSQVIKKYTKSLTIQRGHMISFSLIDMGELLAEKEEQLQKEREALVKIYESLDGENWINKDNWCSDKPIGEWSGVAVDGEGHVSRLFLWDSSIKGFIPKEIGDLKWLRSLSIAGLTPDESTEELVNGIEGSIPESIGSLVDLEILGISCKGNIPHSLCKLEKLKQLTLIGVSIDGGEEVDGYEYPSGSLDCIGNFINLEFLQLMDCRGTLTGDFSRLDNLTEVHINSNLKGNLPNFSDAALLKMRNAMLNGNRFTGTVPSNYALALDSPEFQYSFWILDNCLSGELPREIVSHPSFAKAPWLFLANQKDGYGIKTEKVPASRNIYATLNGGEMDLGAQYSRADYTMLVRWSEACLPSRGFLPSAITLAKKYKEYGLQTIWSYAGGNEDDRKEFMREIGMSEDENHIIELHQFGSWDTQNEQALWADWYGTFTPFVEVVDKDGFIIFIDDPNEWFTQQSFSFKRSKLEAFLANLFDDQEEFYISSDYSADGRTHVLQEASEGYGINVILMGDGFSDRLIADGTYQNAMQKAMEALFKEEPYKSMRNRFNVLSVDVVSKNESYNGITALDTWYGNGTSVGGNEGAVLEYARRALPDEQMDDALIIVVMNRDYYAGTCYMHPCLAGDYGRGLSVAYFPNSSDVITFNAIVSHEAGGHGFAKLDDEYSYPVPITTDVISDKHTMEPFGWWKNVDFTNDPAQVKWSRFLSDIRYENEGLGVFEGACTYAFGAFRPTQESIMNQNTGGFNAPSRYAIWYRINKLAYGADWNSTKTPEEIYEEFVTFDLATRPSSTSASQTAARHRSYVEKSFEPLAPPVVVSKDWREVLK